MSAIINFAQKLCGEALAPFRINSFELCKGGKSKSMFELMNLYLSIGYLINYT